MSQIGMKNFELTQLSQAASSKYSYREPSIETNKGSGTRSNRKTNRNINRKQEGEVTLRKNQRNNKFKNQKTPSSSKEQKLKEQVTLETPIKIAHSKAIDCTTKKLLRKKHVELNKQILEKRKMQIL